MIREDKVELNKTARKEELLAYIICKDYIFGDKECFIGDSTIANCPDIYTKDFSVGAEVVVCETADTLQKIQKRKIGNAFDNAKTIKNKKSLYEYRKQFPSINSEYKKYISEEKEFFYNFENCIIDKIKNQKNEHYKACKQMNLIVMSCFNDKEFVNDEDIFYYCQTLMEMYGNSYNAIYVVLGDRTLKIDNNFNRIILSDLRQKFAKEEEK